MTEKENSKRQYKSRSFPKYSLKEVLKIAESIRDNNNLQPYNRLNLAHSLNQSPSSSKFRMRITSSNSYGLTKGSYAAEKISLSPLGTSIISPKSDEEKNESLKKALFNIPIFQRFFTNFNNGKVPRKDLLMNTLHRDFGISASDTEACYEIIMKNAKELDILTEIKGSQYFQLDKLSSVQKEVMTEESEEEELQEKEEIEERPAEAIEEIKKEPMAFRPKVFISHSKNKKIVNQIKEILNFGQFDHVIAEERETAAIPISEKVFGSMSDCNCAIINISADEHKNEDDEFRINQNVLIEIGAAFLKYNKKVILLVDKRLVECVPSNLHGLYRCEYQGDELSFETAMKLQKALTSFR